MGNIVGFLDSLMDQSSEDVKRRESGHNRHHHGCDGAAMMAAGMEPHFSKPQS